MVKRATCVMCGTSFNFRNGDRYCSDLCRQLFRVVKLSRRKVQLNWFYVFLRNTKWISQPRELAQRNLVRGCPVYDPHLKQFVKVV